MHLWNGINSIEFYYSINYPSFIKHFVPLFVRSYYYFSMFGVNSIYVFQCHPPRFEFRVYYGNMTFTQKTRTNMSMREREEEREKSTFSLLPYILAIEWLCLVDGFCEYYSDVRCDILCYCRVVVSTCCSKCYFNDKIEKLKCAECTYTRSHDIENK